LESIIIIEDIIIPLIAIAAAELGDKTQISVLLISSKTNKHIQILIGVMLAFLIVDGIAIALGSWITEIIPIRYLKIFSGIIFIILGIFMMMNKKSETEQSRSYHNPFITAFLLILLTEWGDKTQIAAALFATRYNPLMVLIGTILALFVLSIIAIFFGKMVSEKIPKETINKIAGIIFILMGITFFMI
jgi:putative Ca2+/H+ antiporter (TMEM165/GDT1 family)